MAAQPLANLEPSVIIVVGPVKVHCLRIERSEDGRVKMGLSNDGVDECAKRLLQGSISAVVRRTGITA